MDNDEQALSNPHPSAIDQSSTLTCVDTNADTDTQLCQDCRKVDWSNLNRLIQQSGRPLLRLRAPRDDLLARTCPLCRFIGGLTWFDPSSQGPGRIVLRSDYLFNQIPDSGIVKMQLGSSESFSTYSDQKANVLAPPKRELIAFREAEDGKCIDDRRQNRVDDWQPPARINFAYFRQKMEECKAQHRERCWLSDRVPRLRMIAVATGEIVIPLTDGNEPYMYAALSYVWGDAEEAQRKLDNAVSFPLLIRDAMYVTHQLGIEYLWVDNYCIDQKSPHKQSLINQMDRIYGSADITIISASSHSAQEGLPGVTGPQRIAKQSIKIGSTRILEACIDGSYTVRNSIWATRGWTFQEGYLSKRRLIFTDKEVLYLCNTLYAQETIGGGQNFNRQYTNNSATIFPHHEQNVFGRFLWMMPAQAPLSPSYDYNLHWRRSDGPALNLEILIAEYTSRKLSFPSDTLNAFLGILTYHDNTVKACYDAARRSGPGPRFEPGSGSGLGPASQAEIPSHLWALPIRNGPRLASGERTVALNMSWRHDSGVTATAVRRPEFPSWSWLGWTGPVMFRSNASERGTRPGTVMLKSLKTPEDSRKGECKLWEVHVRASGSGGVGGEGELCKLSDHVLALRPMGANIDVYMGSKELMVRSFVMPLQLRSLQLPQRSLGSEKERQRMFLMLPLGGGNLLGVLPWWDREVKPQDESTGMLGLVVPPLVASEEAYSGKEMMSLLRDQSYTCHYSILILHQVGVDRFERAGIVNLSYYAGYGRLEGHGNGQTIGVSAENDIEVYDGHQKKWRGEPYGFEFLGDCPKRTIRLV